jgi:hypothetical protein
VSASWPAVIFAVFVLFFAVKLGFAVYRGETSFGRGQPKMRRRPEFGYWLLLVLYIFMLLMSARLTVDWVREPAAFSVREPVE